MLQAQIGASSNTFFNVKKMQKKNQKTIWKCKKCKKMQKCKNAKNAKKCKNAKYLFVFY